MADRKITDLVDGAPLQPTDEFVVARGGDNFKVDGAEVVAAVTKHDVTLAGNTAGALAHISSGTMTLAGGNNITLSQAGNAVTISGGAGGAETQTAISGISASDALYTSGTVRFTGSQGATIRSGTGQLVVVDVPATSSLSATGAVSISVNGSTVSIGAPTQTVQTQNLIAATLDGNTDGALALISSGTLTLAGGNNITLSQAGNAVTISGAAAGGAQTFIGGISASDTLYTSGTVRFTGSQAATVRSGTGQLVVIDVPAQSTQVETQTFIAGISASDTLYTSGNVRITGVGGGVTVSSNTGQRVDISVAAQSVQPETQTFIAGVSASDTLYTSGNVRITGVGGGITVSSNTGQRIDLSVAAQSVQPETQTFIAGISASNTLYTSGNVRFTGSQAVTVRSGTGQLVVIDAPAQSVQPETQTFIAGVSASDTLYTSGNVRITGVGGGVTVSSNTGQRVDISVAAPVAATNLSIGVSNAGNTSGNTTVNTGSRFVIVGSNGITASQGTAAGATTVTLSGVTQSAQTQGIINAGVTNAGNTAGDTGVASGTRLVFVGTDNVTLSQATAANATTISIQAAGGGAGAFSAGVSTGGNTAGDTGVTGTRMVFVGSGPISLSQATAAAGGTISVNAPATSSLSATGAVSISTNGSTISIGVPLDTLSYFDPNGLGSKVVGVFPGNASLAIQPWNVPVPYCHDRVAYPVQYSQATNSTLTVTVSAWFGLYTRNVSTLSLFTSGSNTFSINGSGTASSAQNSGLKFLTFGWTETVTPGDYWLGAVSRTTTAGANASLSNVAVNFGVSNSAWSGLMGVAANSTNQMRLGLGTWTATTAGMPASVAFSNLAGSSSAAHRVPWVWFLSQTV